MEAVPRRKRKRKKDPTRKTNIALEDAQHAGTIGVLFIRGINSGTIVFGTINDATVLLVAL